MYQLFTQYVIPHFSKELLANSIFLILYDILSTSIFHAWCRNNSRLKRDDFFHSCSCKRLVFIRICLHGWSQIAHSGQEHSLSIPTCQLQGVIHRDDFLLQQEVDKRMPTRTRSPALTDLCTWHPSPALWHTYWPTGLSSLSSVPGVDSEVYSIHVWILEPRPNL